MQHTLESSETFSNEERNRLKAHCSNSTQRCFAVTNLPEVVKGALFARYSHSAKSLRRLLLDEFAEAMSAGAAPADTERADRLYERVLGAYGDDSVAQLGSAHVACEGVSNVLTKILERGRLMSYLEQSTRYVPYDQQVNGKWKYVTPPEIGAHLHTQYWSAMDGLFETYAKWLPQAMRHFEQVRPRAGDEDENAYRRAIRSKALDTLRGLLPAATRSNMGIHGSGQAFEALLLRLRSHPLEEANEMGEAMLTELKTVIPAFVQRVERPERGGEWARFLTRRQHREAQAAAMTDQATKTPDEDVKLLEYDAEGESKVFAALAYPASEFSLDDIRALTVNMDRELISDKLASDGTIRNNRRHRPPRALEHTEYLFEITGDYGAFRDLQRHRMLSIDWQPLEIRHGLTRPEAIDQMGAGADWNAAMGRAIDAYEQVKQADGRFVAQYTVPMAFRIRFAMRLNAREAMHMIELRTQPAGHPSYRRVCQKMHRLIAAQAGHRGIAAMMRFANHDGVELARMAAETRTAEREATR